MALLFPLSMVEHSTHAWLPRVNVRSQVIYTTLLISVLAGLVSLYFIRVDISLSAAGLIRPVAEKNEVRSPVSGTIADILVGDGATVREGQLLMRLKQDIQESKLMETDFDLGQHEQYMHDLAILAQGGSDGLVSALYRGEYARFESQLAEQSAGLVKLRSDFVLDKQLLSEHVIAPREFQDKQFEMQKAQAAFQATVDAQRSDWQEEFNKMRLESSQLHADASQLREESQGELIRAPIGGTLQQFEGKSPGGFVQAGEVLGVISPDSNLVAECYVSPRDIGYMHPGMRVRFQVDAFSYTDWGVLQGRVSSIGKDFILVDGKPVFKVRCTLSQTYLEQRDGVRGNLIKGMTLQARFLLTRRSLYDLLYERSGSWFR